MNVIICDQGSQQWHLARAGVITASMFSTARSKVGTLNEQQRIYVEAILSGKSESSALALAKYKSAPSAEGVKRALNGEKVGEFSEAAKNYAFRLAIERISGQPLDEGFETFAMRRGHELEPEARMEHEMQTGLIVQKAGFVTTEDNCFGASADGLIDDDGGAEYKCFINPEKLRVFHLENDASEIFDQAQGCMWVTGRKYWHIALYCPALKAVGRQLWFKRFERDEEYIEQLEADLLEFKLLVDDYEARLRNKAA